MAEDKKDCEVGDGICLHCRLIAAVQKWSEDEKLLGIDPLQEMEDAAGYIMFSLCRIMTDILLADRGQEAFEGFRENLQRTVKTLTDMHNEEAPDGCKISMQFGNVGKPDMAQFFDKRRLN